jgi:DNA invertase Pin-like site-specific DNA recombinase
MKNVSYLRVSTEGQDTEKNKADVLTFANERNFGKVDFVEEKVSGMQSWKDREIKAVIDGMEPGDRLIVPELSRLGRSMLEIMEILSVAKGKEISVYAVKGAWELNGTIQSQIIGMVFAMCAEIERDLISARTKEGMRARKQAGIKMGRPKGAGKSKLDEHRAEIENLLQAGVSKSKIARKIGCSVQILYHWIEKNGIQTGQESH